MNPPGTIPLICFRIRDVVYIVNETKSFLREDKHGLTALAERLSRSCRKKMVYYPSDVDQSYGWLIQFADGSRLDLSTLT